MKNRIFRRIVMLTVLLAGLGADPASAQVVLDDSLQGSTIGTREGGSFVSGGWRVDGQYNTIYWHVPVLAKGAFEYDVRGIGSACSGGLGEKNELSHMYDFTFGNADINYNGGYRDSPNKQFLRKQCCCGKENTMEILWQILPEFLEDDSSALSWDSNTTYRFRNEWENVGGNSVIRTYRNGVLILTQTVPGSWNPGGQSVRIAASPRRADEGAHVGAIYSNVKVYDLSSFVPGAPSITSPASGETIKPTVAFVEWTGDSHSLYQVRVCTGVDPDANIVWDSQQVASSRFFSYTGTLANATYNAFVRLGTTSGWGPWSSPRTFTVNTSHVPPGANLVRIKGNSFTDNDGPFLALGATYMRALRNCKFDRTRYNNDCSFLASKQYNYIRILSMVAWQGLEIAPVSFGSVSAWSDYIQQLKDCIDIAYTFGLRTELTIFADAQIVMPSKSVRITHMDNILAALVGREHKIIHLEVANEAWQNGFPGSQGIADLREFCQYLTDRTTIPVAISSPDDTSDSGIQALYSGSTADLTTVHFSRDIGTVEGGWLPVRDSYRTGLGGLPPVSSNEPIGPGSSVSTENDPIKLCMAGVFAWTANLPAYVWHSRAGVFGWTNCCPPSGSEVFFSGMAGVDSYVPSLGILPKDLASWERNDGKASASPFTSYANGQANKWWTEVSSPSSGCVRNISAVKGPDFVTCPIGILGGGLQLEARRPMNFTVYNPLTGAVVLSTTKNASEQFTLSQGPQAYIIKGFFTDVPGGGGGSGTEVTIDLGSPDILNGLTHGQGGDGDTVADTIGGRTGRKNVNSAEDFYFYFGVSDAYAFNGNRPDQYISIDYYDTGTATYTLQYDSVSGGAYKAGPTVVLTNTNTWKTVTFHVTDAYFGNRQNGGADFRIFLGTNVTGRLDFIKVSVEPPQAGQAPYNGSPFTVPGLIQAEQYDLGGEGVAYHDIDAINSGGQFRSDGVDIEVTTDTGGGYNVGWTAATEYLEYTTNVSTTGDYAIKMRVASNEAGGSFHLSLNGNNITPTKSFANTGGWQNWTTIIVPGIFLSSTTNNILRLTMDSGDINVNYLDFAFGGDDVVSYDLDSTSIEDGMTHPQVGDGDTTGASVGGHFCRRNVNPAEDFYMYFAVFDSYTFNGNFPTAAITIDYFDNDNGSLVLQYDGAGSPYTVGPSVVRTNTNTWKQVTFNVSDAYFGNRQNSGADFRIAAPVGATFYLDTIMVHTSAASTPGPATSPNPANGATGVAINASLSWTAGSGATSHDVRFGTSNPPPFIQNQTATTYTPPTMSPNTTYFWRIDEKNAAGTTTGTVWSFTTLPLPGAASSPSPANGATGVAISGTTLSWTAGSNATSHDVRFGTSNPPPFIQNQAGTTYVPGTLSPGTTYFWRIDEKNSSGTTNGTVWSFTTLPLPGAASAPNPANAATGVSVSVSLSWTAGSNATSHDVRFGTANPPPFIQNQAGTTYAPGTLSPGTTYFWRIDEKNSSGTTNGTVWSFTTLPLPGAASSPNPANAATGVSTSVTLSWTAGSNATSRDVRFGTANPPPFIQNQTATTYAPGTLSAGTTYFWRIDEKNGSGTTTGTVWSFTTAVATCFSDAFAYSNGNLNGNGGWSGSAGSEIQIVNQTVKINGGSGGLDAIRTVSCSASGGFIQIAVKIQKGTGSSTMWSLWFDDPSGVNICRLYGTATTARGRIGGSATVTAEQTLTGGWDDLLVKINPSAQTAEFFINSVSFGTLSYSGQGAGSTLGRLRFERINNAGAAGNSISFDDLTVD